MDAVRRPSLPLPEHRNPVIGPNGQMRRQRDSAPRRRPDQDGAPRNTSGVAYRIDWERWRAPLYELSVTQNLTAEQVATEIARQGLAVSPKTLKRHFASGPWPEFKKNRRTSPTPKGQAPRRRGVRITRSAYGQMRDHLLSRIPPTPGPPARQDANGYAWRMLRSIRCLIEGTLDPSWSNIHPPQDRLSLDSWRLVYDKCLGIAGIGGLDIRPGKLWFLRDQIFKQLENAAPKARSVAFLIHFWGICACLVDIRLFVRIRSSPSPMLQVFLSQLRDHFLAFTAGRDDLVVVVESILAVLVSAPLYLKTVLGIGCVQTADLLEQTMGRHHALVLKAASVTSSYGHLCKPRSSSEQDYLDRYQPLLDAINQESPTCSDIEILHDFTVSQRHAKPTGTPKHAELLHKFSLRESRAALGSGPLTYNAVSRAMAYSAELLAVCQLDPGSRMKKPEIQKRDQGFRYVAEAVELLSRGDLECQVRAAHLSKRLTIWLKTYFSGRQKGGLPGDHTRVIRQRSWTTAIVARIDELGVPLRRTGIDNSHDNIYNSGLSRRERGGSSDASSLEDLQNNQAGSSKPLKHANRRRTERTALRIGAFRSIAEEASAETRNTEKIDGPNAPRVAKRRQEKGPAKTPPQNPDRTCRNCGETFVSRQVLFGHLEGGCEGRHNWAMDNDIRKHRRLTL